MTLAPIKKSATLKEQAYERIKEAIYTNALKPGEALAEEQLSAMLSISRTPIRSALQQLVFDKLAVTDNTGHIYVSSISEKDVADITVMRTNLEPLAIDYITFPISDEYINKLHSIYNQQMELVENDPENNMKFSELDTQFHNLIASLSGNSILADTVLQLNTMMIRINVLSGTLHKNMERAMSEHKNIIAYLENGQAAFAKLALSEHVKNVGVHMLDE